MCTLRRLHALFIFLKYFILLLLPPFQEIGILFQLSRWRRTLIFIVTETWITLQSYSNFKVFIVLIGFMCYYHNIVISISMVMMVLVITRGISIITLLKYTIRTWMALSVITLCIITAYIILCNFFLILRHLRRSLRFNVW